jgi:hypothetical protein
MFATLAAIQIMEPTYKLLGGDGQQYGPVTAEQFRAWVRDGRADAQTQVMRSDQSGWRAAHTFPEFNLAVPAVAPTTPSINSPAANDAGLDQRIRSGASWFYWIAALSLINSVLLFARSSIGFALGLGVTREIDWRMGQSPAVALTLDVLVCGVVALFGFLAIKRIHAAFVIGMVVLALDAALTIHQQAWLSLAFHAWALFSIFMAFQASRAARRG